ncbi:Riboflavin transporter mch5 [Fusarium acuminatum]|uniref:Riboflavin transporter mch5 n=1 Tax=Fusarium acuminatum TaxID=5515 RepID=A0ABZ2X3W5_9HYPO
MSTLTNPKPNTIGHNASPSLDFKQSLDLQEKVASEDPFDDTEVPDGGTQAWLVAAGAACIFFSCLGFANSFGVMQEYYMSHQLQGHSADKIAWIGSMSTFIQFAGGALAGPMFDRYGSWVIRPAAIIYVFATMMTSLCTEYWHFMLAQGVLMGTSMAFLQIPAFAALSQYFDKKRAAAFGIAVSGSSIGGVIFPIALSKMLNDSSLGFGWSIRVMGFVMIPLMTFSSITVRPRLPSRKTSLFLGAAFKDPLYLLIIVSLFFIFIGMFAPLFFLPSYAVTRGIDPTLASYFLAITNAASTFGRIIPGILADKYGRLNMYSLGGLSTGIVILCMNEAKTTAALVVYALVFGFTSGTIISGVSAAFALVSKDPRNNGTYMGMGLAVSSFAALIGPPVNGALVDRYGGFFQVSVFSGVVCLFGGCLAATAKVKTKEGIWGRV